MGSPPTSVLFGGSVGPEGLPFDSPSLARRPRLPTPVQHAIRVLCFVVLSTICVAGFALLASPVVPLSDQLKGHVMSAVVGILGMTSAYLLLTVLCERRRPPIELAPHRALGLAWGLVLGAGAFLIVYLLITLAGGFRIAGSAEVNWTTWWLDVLAVGAHAGIVQEILFRGVFFRFVEEITGTWIAIAVSGIAFGLLHIDNPDATLWASVAVGLEAGLLLGVLYAYTRSLWVLIGFHAAWNVVQGPVLGVIVSGTGPLPSLLRTTAQGPDLISGGSFGAEASILTVMVLMALAVVMAICLVRRRAVVAPAWMRRAR